MATLISALSPSLPVMTTQSITARINTTNSSRCCFCLFPINRIGCPQHVIIPLSEPSSSRVGVRVCLCVRLRASVGPAMKNRIINRLAFSKRVASEALALAVSCVWLIKPQSRKSLGSVSQNKRWTDRLLWGESKEQHQSKSTLRPRLFSELRRNRVSS